MFCDAAVEPAVGTVHGFFHVGAAFGFCKVIECHVDVGTNRPLGLHGGFWSDFEATTVDVGFEFDALFGNFNIGQTEDLEATRVSESGFMPGIELGEAAGFLNQFSTRAKN